ncbi:hypothetical protein GTO27_08290 [Candidatus Bathyarchaeota archaeon]|nr:hypothetical protein [Candidatus Bathyarchaeota archaeon]
MSETPTVPSTEIRLWLEKETNSVFVPIHEKAKRMLNEMRKELDNLEDVCEMLLENSKKEIEKRNMKTYGRARALNKLARLYLKRVRKIKDPSEVSYNSLHDFLQETQNAFIATEVDVRNWFPKISPFFILDRRKFQGIFERAKETVKTIHSFMEKEYVKTKILEDTFQLIERLLVLESQLTDVRIKMEKATIRENSLEKQIAEIQQQIVDLKNKQSLSEMEGVQEDIKKLRRRAQYSLRHLRKPFVKYERLVQREAGLTPEELRKLNDYIEDPLRALATEEADYPRLREILKKLEKALSQGKVKLKSSRARKAKENIHSILNGDSLVSLHKECRRAIAKREQLLTSSETVKAKKGLAELRDTVGRLKKKRKRVELEKTTIEQNLKGTLNEIKEDKGKIEKNVLEFLGRGVHVEPRV